MEDQSHIGLFLEAAPIRQWRPQSGFSQSDRCAPSVSRRASPGRSRHRGAGSVGSRQRWRERSRSTELMYGQVYGAVSQIPGLRLSATRSALPTPGQYDVELILESQLPAEQLMETTAAVLGAGWQSGKFLYVDYGPLSSILPGGARGHRS